MTTYAIGDIQGCYSALQRLLESIEFDPAKDVLWSVGDLVNRGEDSLAVLRLLRDLGDAAVCVLGNHDISLIAAHYGILKVNPSMDAIMAAPDREELIAWLKCKPLVVADHKRKLCMSHAGLYPRWSVKKALKLAREVEAQLQGDDVGPWLRRVYGNKPNKWSKKLQGDNRHRFIINALTRMRFLHKNGSLELSSKVPPQANRFKVPWFYWGKPKNQDYTIIFGHWASLGYYHGNSVAGLDTGCVWGDSLTAINLDLPPERFQPISVSCK